ncbi:MAG: ureidoglycolate lyase [Pseudomonadota bacterium]
MNTVSFPLVAETISADGFAPFGELIEVSGDPTTMINAGRCKRYTDMAKFDLVDGRLGLSLFDSDICALPVRCDLLERHPLGSQCFVPMGGSSYIVVVAEDDAGTPHNSRAFVASSNQAVNIGRNIWHGVLSPISGSGLFAVLDRIGPGANLEEVTLKEPLQIMPTPGWNRAS